MYDVLGSGKTLMGDRPVDVAYKAAWCDSSSIQGYTPGSVLGKIPGH